MTGLAVVVLLVVALVVGLKAWMESEAQRSQQVRNSEPPPTEAELLQARLEIHRVERSVDVALAKHESRMAAERTKQAIAEALSGWQ